MIFATLAGFVAPAHANNRKLVYQGRVLRPDGSPLEGVFKVQIKIYSPDPKRCLLWGEEKDVSFERGAFSVEAGDASKRLAGPNAGGSTTFTNVFLNDAALALTGLTCDDGTVYTPTATDDRVMVVTLFDGPSAVRTFDGPIKAVPFAIQATNAEMVGGYSAPYLLKVNPLGAHEPTRQFSTLGFSILYNLAEGAPEVDFGGKLLKGLTDPVDPQDAATKNYVDQQLSTTLGTLNAVRLVEAVSASSGVLAVTGGPVTSEGTFSIGFEEQGAGVLAAPTGGTGQPVFRSIVDEDILSLDVTKLLGTLAVSQGGLGNGAFNGGELPIYNALTSRFEGKACGDGEVLVWMSPLGWDCEAKTAGAVTSVDLSMPVDVFNVVGGPVTSAGSFEVSFNPQSVGLVFAAPTGPSGTSGVPVFRALEASDIPDLDASKITSGTFDVLQIPDLDASKIVSGTFDVARIPDLDAAKITSGTFDVLRIPDLDAAKITSGTFDVLRIPDLDASKIVSGTLGVERGGTGLDGSAAGTGQLLIGDGTGGFALGHLIGSSGIIIDNYSGSVGISLDPLASGAVTHVGFEAPLDVFNVVGAPLTGAGTISLSFGTQDVAHVFAAPTGASGVPQFRALIASDITDGIFDVLRIPDLDASKIVSGTLAVERGGTGLDGSAAGTGQLLIGDGTGGFALGNLIGSSGVIIDNYGGSIGISLDPLASGAVTHVGFEAPLDVFNIVGSPLTGAGTISLSFGTQGVAQVFAAPTGASGVPEFRALIASDITTGTFDVGLIPDLDASKITTGTFDVARIPDLDAAKIVSGTLDVLRIPDLDASKIVSGTLAVERGGTGLDGSAAGTGQLLIGDGLGGFALGNLFGSSGVIVDNYSGSIGLSLDPLASGAVTHVGFEAPLDVFNIVGAPLTGAGTISLSFGTQGVAQVFAAPTGASGVPEFRALIASDITTGTFDVGLIPDLDASKITTGTLAVERGGTGLDGSAAGTGQLLIGDGLGGFALGNLFGSSGVIVDNYGGSIGLSLDPLASGAVTHVGFEAPLDVFNIVGAPLTGAGTISLSFGTQGVAQVFAAPTGASGVPEFRALVASDITTGTFDVGLIPDLDAAKIVSGTFDVLRIPDLDASKITSGTLPVELGGTGLDGSAAGSGQLLIGDGLGGFALGNLIGSSGVIVDNYGGSIGISLDPLASGAVTHVGFEAPLDVFNIVGAPLTGAGTISLSFGTQNVAHVFAAPTGASGVPEFRALIASDITAGTFDVGLIPDLDAAKIVSGTFDVLRIPDLDASKITTGTLAVERGGTGLDGSAAGTGQLLIGDGLGGFALGNLIGSSGVIVDNYGGSIGISLDPLAGGAVTHVGFEAPLDVFNIVGAPLTGAGTISLSFGTQNVAHVFAAPTGASGVPEFRALIASDITAGTFDVGLIPDLDAAKIVSGTFDVLRIPDLDASKITTGTLAVERGGTGLDGSAAGTGQLLIGDGLGGFALGNLIGSSGVIVDNYGGSIGISLDPLAGGAVTHVGFEAPLDVFNIVGAPLTGAGTISLSFGTQNVAHVFAAPTGASGVPEFRALIASDITAGTFDLALIPDLDAAKIVSGTLDVLRIPDLDASKITTGTLAVERGGTGLDGSAAGTGQLLIGDGLGGFALGNLIGSSGVIVDNYGGSIGISLDPLASGAVTHVGFEAPLDVFNIVGSPLTGAGTISLSFGTQNVAHVFAAPTGASGVPEFRALIASDITAGTFDVGLIPDLDAAKIVSGTLDVLRIPDLDASKITTGTLAVERGGTGLDGSVAGTGQILIGTGTGGFALGNLFGSSGVIIDNYNGSVGISLDPLAGGAVTHVGFEAPTSVFSVIGSPLTGAGTISLSFGTQNVAHVFAAPTGASGVPEFRALIASDITAGTFDVGLIPDLDASKITTGTLAVERGGTGLDGSVAGTGQLLIGTGTGGFAIGDLIGGPGVSIANQSGSITISTSGGTLGWVQGGNSFGATGVLGTNDAFPLALRTNGSTAMTITAAGLVGIGTASPDTNSGRVLHIYNDLNTGTADSNAELLLESVHRNAAAVLKSSSTGVGQLIFSNSAGEQNGRIGYNHNDDWMWFSTDDQVRMSLTGDGRMVLGTTGVANTAILDLQATGDQSALVLPRDTSAGRPAAPVAGMIRYNSDLGRYEVYQDAQWMNIQTSTGTISGSVTNVGLEAPTSIFSVTGGPVTNAGTFQITLGTQGVAQVFAAPTGASGVPSFRSLEASDIVSGILPVERGGTGLDGSVAGTGQLLIGNGTGGFAIGELIGGPGVTVANQSGSITISTTGGTLGWLQGGNAFGQTGTLGTNDNQDLAILTNGTTRMSITAGGSVGIGTSTPSAPLTVESAGGSPQILVSGTNAAGYAYTQFAGSGRNYSVGVGNSSESLLGVADKWFVYDHAVGVRMALDPNGHLGIGTTAPSGRLHVEGGEAIIGPLAAGSGNAGRLQLRELAANGTNGVSLRAPDALAANYTLTLPAATGASGQFLSTDAAGNLSWATNPGGTLGWVHGGNAFGMTGTLGTNDNHALAIRTNGTTHMTLTGGGSLGLGTATPSFKLHVESPSGNVASFQSTTSGAHITMKDSATTIHPGIGALGNHLLIASSGIERVRISSSGDVGIGTTAPSGRLHVEGGEAIIGPLAAGSGNAGSLQLRELAANGTNGVSLRAPDALAANYVLTLPAATGSSGQFLSTDATGNLSWATNPGGTLGWVHGGNAFGQTGTLGTNDNQALVLKTNDVPRLTLSNTGALELRSNSTLAIAVGGSGTTNPAFSVDASRAGSVTGLRVLSDVAGMGVELTASSPNVSEDLYLYPKGNGRLYLSQGLGSVVADLGDNGFKIWRSAATDNSANPLFTLDITPGTALPAGQEAPLVNFDFNHTRVHASNTNIPLQREIKIQPSTHAFGTAGGTITNAAALAIEAVPRGGANATITNSSGLMIRSAAVTGVTNSYGLNVAATTGAANNYAAIFTGGNVGIGTAAPSGRLHVEGGEIIAGPLPAGSGNAGRLQLRELAANGTNGVSLRAPDALAANYVLTLPAATGASGQFLSTDASGNLSWATNPGGTLGWVHGGNSFAQTGTLGTNDNFGFVLETNNAPRMTVTSGGTFLFGANSQWSNEIYRFHTEQTATADGWRNALAITTSVNPASSSLAEYNGLFVRPILDSNSSIDRITGVLANPSWQSGAGAVNTMQGFLAYSQTRSNIALLNGFEATAQLDGGTVSHYSGFEVSTPTINTGTITNSYGVYVHDMVGTNQFGIYQAGANDTNYFGGSVGIGISNPSGRLHVAGGELIVGPLAAGSGNAGRLQLRELAGNGTNGVSLRAPDALAANYILTLPAATGVSGQFLSTDASGNLSWATNPGGTLGWVQGGNAFGATGTLGTNDNHPLAFETNNNTRMTITAGGSVGIGTATPDAPLHLSRAFTNAGSGDVFMNLERTGDNSGGGPFLAFTDDGARRAAIGAARTGSNAGDLLFYTQRNSGTTTWDSPIGFNEKMRLTYDGHLGLGTTAPSGRLHVEGGEIIAGPLAAGSGNAGRLQLRELAANGTNGVSLRAPDALAANYILTLPAATGVSGQLLTTDANGNLGWVTNSGGSLNWAHGGNSFGQTGTLGTNDNHALALRTAGTTRMTITDDGGIGIGIAAPVNARMQIVSPASPTLAIGPSTANNAQAYLSFRTKNSGAENEALILANNTGELQFKPQPGQDSVFYSDSTPIMVLKSTGSIGIGTISPNARLHVEGSQAIFGPIAAGAGNAGRLQLRELAANGTHGVSLRAPDALAANYILTLPAATGTSGQLLTTDASGQLSWVTNSGGSLNWAHGGNSFGQTGTLGTNDNHALALRTAGTTRMTILNDGKIGIGTTAPWYQMQMEGADADPMLYIGNTSSTSAHYPGLVIENYKGSGSLGAPKIGFLNSRGSRASPAVSQNGDVLGYLEFYGATNTSGGQNRSGGITFTAAGTWSATSAPAYFTVATTPTGSITETERLRISPEGNVGIGTTAPSGRLHVEGGEIIAGPLAAGAGNSGRLQLRELVTNGTNGVSLRAPDLLAGNVTLTLPAATGTSGQFLATDASGNLSWATNPGGTLGWVQGGNSFGQTGTLGTNDNFPLAFETNNNTRMTITAGGSVGIGTASPTAHLMIQTGANARSAFKIHDGEINTVVGMYGSGTNGWLTSHFAGNIEWNGTHWALATDTVHNGGGMTAFDMFGGAHFYTVPSTGSTPQTITDANINNYRRMTIAGDGRIGFGTAAPQAPVHVASTGSGNIRIERGSNGFWSGLDFHPSGTLSTSTPLWGTGLTSWSNGYSIWTNNGSVDTTRFFVNTAGNVGIGTTAPSGRLHVEGGEAIIGPLAAGAGNSGRLQLRELATNGTNGVSLRAPDALAGNVTLTLPAATGASGQFLATDASGNLSWATNPGGTLGWVQGGNSFGQTGTLGTNDNHPLAFETNNNTRMTITAGGSVGIGIAAPLDLVHVATNSATNQFVSITTSNTGAGAGVGFAASSNAGNMEMKMYTTAGGGAGQIQTSGRELQLQAYASTGIITMYAGNSSTERARMTATGNFGIGTSAPSGRLHVEGGEAIIGPLAAGAGNSGRLQLRELAANGTNGVSLRAADAMAANYTLTLPAATGVSGQLLTTDANGNLGWVTNSGGSLNWSQGGNSFAQTGTLGTNDNQALAIRTAGTTRMTITAGGSVGIGTASPVAMLSVQGSAQIDSGLTVYNNVNNVYSPTGGTNAPNVGGHWFYNPSATAGAASALVVGARNASGYNHAYFGAVSPASGYIPTIVIGQQTAANTYAERLRIDASGNMGLGTSAPSGRLHVEGGEIIAGPVAAGAGNSGRLQLRELAANGTNGVSLRAADAMAANYTLTLPAATGASGQLLTTDANGNLGWVTNSGGSLNWSQGGNSFAQTGTLGTNDNHPMTIRTNGTTRMAITAGGSVGIGTTTPAETFHVYGDSAKGLIESSNANWGPVLRLKANSGKMYGIYNAGSSDPGGANTFGIYDYGATAVRFMINENGRVGIGTEAPSGLFHLSGGEAIIGPVAAGAGNAGRLQLRELAANGTNGVSLRAPDAMAANYTLTLPAATGTSGQFLATNASGQLSWVTNSGGTTSWAQGGNSFGQTGTLGTNDNQALAIRTNGTTRMSITSSGLINIGGDPPVNWFRMTNYNSSFGQILDDQWLDSGIYQASSSKWGGFYLWRSRGTAASPSYVQNGDYLGVFGFRNHVNSDGAGIYSLATQNHSGSVAGSDLRFNIVPNGQNSSQLAMTIGQNGRVGIGTASPIGPFQALPYSQTSITNSGHSDIENYSVGAITSGSSKPFTSFHVQSVTGASINLWANGASWDDHGWLKFAHSARSTTSEITAQIAAIGAIATSSTNNSGGALSFEVRPQGGNTFEAMRLSPAGNLGIGTNAPSGILHLVGTTTANSALVLPAANTAARPTGINGMVRYNTQTSRFEGYQAGSWQNFSVGTTAVSGAPAEWKYTANGVDIQTVQPVWVQVAGTTGMNPAAPLDVNGNALVRGNLFLANSTSEGELFVTSSGGFDTLNYNPGQAGVGFDVRSNTRPVVTMQGPGHTSYLAVHSKDSTYTSPIHNAVLNADGFSWIQNHLVVGGNSDGNAPLAQMLVSGQKDNSDAILAIVADAANNDENKNPMIMFAQDANQVQGWIGLAGTGQQAFNRTITGAADNALILNHDIDDNTGKIQFATEDVVRMTIAQNGQIAVGTHTPQNILHALSPAGSQSAFLQVGLPGTSPNSWTGLWLATREGANGLGHGNARGWAIEAPGNGHATSSWRNDLHFSYWNGSSWQTNMMLDATNGYVGIGPNHYAPGATLDVSGDIQYTGTLTDVSDWRLKENITPLADGLRVVRAIPVYSFTMKDDPDKKVEFGVIAQKVQEIVPQLVRRISPDNDYLGVNYVGLIPWSLKAIQELDQEVTLVKEDVHALKRENQDLKSRMDRLEEQNRELAEQVKLLLELQKRKPAGQ